MSGPVTVSAAMIVRNEERFLAGSLESLRGRVDEIVVVDTGSTDGTIDIAARAGARLLHYAWAQDFAAARNFALDAVSCEWVLYIDADERLNLPEGGVIGDYVEPGAIGGFVRFQPKTGYTCYRECRLFRSEARLRFAGTIHETMVPVLSEISAREGMPIVQTTVEIYHLGYDCDQQHKHARNLALLQSAVRAHPDRVFYWYHLAETLAALGRAQEAEEAAGEGLASAERDSSDKQRADASLIFQFLVRTELGRAGNPLRLIREGLARVPEDYALWFLRGRILLEMDRPLEALEIAERLRAVDPDRLTDGLLAFDRSIFREKACEMAAVACLRLGRRREAAMHFATASRLAPDDFAFRIKVAALGGLETVAS
jgi:tetratricopeptide (TPR) repeat protein